jgi:hypothetical protein
MPFLKRSFITHARSTTRQMEWKGDSIFTLGTMNATDASLNRDLSISTIASSQLSSSCSSTYHQSPLSIMHRRLTPPIKSYTPKTASPQPIVIETLTFPHEFFTNPLRFLPAGAEMTMMLDVSSALPDMLKC